MRGSHVADMRHAEISGRDHHPGDPGAIRQGDRTDRHFNPVEPGAFQNPRGKRRDRLKADDIQLWEAILRRQSVLPRVASDVPVNTACFAIGTERVKHLGLVEPPMEYEVVHILVRAHEKLRPVLAFNRQQRPVPECVSQDLV